MATLVDYTNWFKAVGFRLLVVDFSTVFPCYCLWFKAVGFKISSICFGRRLKASFSCYCFWFKAVAFRL